MAYRLIAHKRVAKELARVPPRIAAALRQALERLAQQPDEGHDLRRIQGITPHPPTLRLRVGTYRILLKVYHDRREILVLRVGLRATVYRGLEHLDDGVSP